MGSDRKIPGLFVWKPISHCHWEQPINIHPYLCQAWHNKLQMVSCSVNIRPPATIQSRETKSGRRHTVQTSTWQITWWHIITERVGEDTTVHKKTLVGIWTWKSEWKCLQRHLWEALSSPSDQQSFGGNLTQHHLGLSLTHHPKALAESFEEEDQLGGLPVIPLLTLAELRDK